MTDIVLVLLRLGGKRGKETFRSTKHNKTKQQQNETA